MDQLDKLNIKSQFSFLQWSVLAARWLEKVMPSDPPIEELRESFTQWIMDEGKSIGLSEEVVKAYEVANPLGMSADGLQRYWKRVRSV